LRGNFVRITENIDEYKVEIENRVSEEYTADGFDNNTSTGLCSL
jgi:hypothetical protein